MVAHCWAMDGTVLGVNVATSKIEDRIYYTVPVLGYFRAGVGMEVSTGGVGINACAATCGL